MQDLHNNIKPALAMDFAARTASANGNIMDLGNGIVAGTTIPSAPFQSLTFAVFTETVTTADASNRFDFKIQHGDLADGTDMADVAAADVQGSVTINNAADDNKLIGKISYNPVSNTAKRYVRLVATEVGTASAAFGAVALFGHPLHAPAN